VGQFTKSVVEDTALVWLESLGWQVMHGPDIAPDTPATERDTLLPKLISGELRVKDAERVVKEAV